MHLDLILTIPCQLSYMIAHLKLEPVTVTVLLNV